MSDKPELRDAMEIQRAHDLLVNIVTGEVDLGDALSKNDKGVLMLALDVLCWTLKHGHNRQFESILTEARDMVRNAGYVEKKAPAAFTLADMEHGKVN